MYYKTLHQYSTSELQKLHLQYRTLNSGLTPELQQLYSQYRVKPIRTTEDVRFLDELEYVLNKRKKSKKNYIR